MIFRGHWVGNELMTEGLKCKDEEADAFLLSPTERYRQDGTGQRTRRPIDLGENDAS